MPTALVEGVTPAPSPEWITGEIARCAADSCYFISTYCSILVQKGDGSRGVEPFTLWPYQAKLVTALSQGGHFIVLKARQLGLTTVMCAYVLWFALFRSNSYILLLSKRDEESRKLLRRVLDSYDKLPQWMRDLLKIGSTRNTQSVSFSSGSFVESMAATEGAGRSDTASLVFIDEADYIADLEATYSAVRPTVDGGGQLVVASTSNGPMTYFAALWNEAVEHTSDLRPVFFPWHVRPDRTPEWYATKKGSYSEHRLKREYPEIWQDAFTSAEALVYPSFNAGIHMEEMHYNPEKREITTRRYGTFKVPFFMAAQDWNVAQPGCFLVGCRAPDGTILIVDGFYEAGIPITSEDPEALTWCTVARQMHAHYPYIKLWCDHQPEGIMAFQRNSLPAVKAIKDVDSGIAAFTAALALRLDGRPGLIFNRTLDFVPKEMYGYMRRKVNGIVTDRVVKQNDHMADCGRYLLMGLAQGSPRITVF